MIYFPATLTPVPYSPGYFWDVSKKKLFSIKVGGVLRELAVKKAHPAMFRHPGASRLGLSVGDKFYRISVDGKARYLPVKSLEKLEIVHYHMPVIMRVEYENQP
jgi:hypothetical protein